MGAGRRTFRQRRQELLRHVKQHVREARVQQASRVDDQEVPEFLRKLQQFKERSKRSTMVFK